MSPDETAGNVDPNLETEEDQNGLNDSMSEEDEELDEASAGAEDDEQSEPDASQKPNIMFVGKEKVVTVTDGESQSEMKPRTPPTHIQNGMEKIKLPGRETQLAGPFYHKQADTIVQLFPQFYKHVK